MRSLTPLLDLTLFLVIGAEVVSSGQSLPLDCFTQATISIETRILRYKRERRVPRISAQRS